MTNPKVYFVRVNPTSATARDGVTVHDPVTGKPWNGGRLSKGAVLGFKQDPKAGTSSIGSFKLSKDKSCDFCDPVAGPDPSALYLQFQQTPDRELLLNAETATGQVYSAANNPPDMDGGRPIIRANIVRSLIIGILGVAAIAILVYLAWRLFGPS